MDTEFAIEELDRIKHTMKRRKQGRHYKWLPVRVMRTEESLITI